MSMNGPLSTPFDSPLVSTPAPGEATTNGGNSGYDLNQGDGKSGLVSSPFAGNSPFTSPSGQSPTPNRSELPNPITFTGPIADAPAPGAQELVVGGHWAPPRAIRAA